MSEFDQRGQTVTYQLNIVGDVHIGNDQGIVQEPRVDAAVRATAPKVFVSYAHEDERWVTALMKHLKPYIRNKRIEAWYDAKIEAGQKWSDEIEKAMAEADAGILLVSPDFLDSDFIFDRELPVLMGKSVFWIPVRASAFDQTPIKDYQAASPPDRPLARQTDAEQDEAWVTICKKIVAALPDPKPPLP